MADSNTTFCDLAGLFCLVTAFFAAAFFTELAVSLEGFGAAFFGPEFFTRAFPDFDELEADDLGTGAFFDTFDSIDVLPIDVLVLFLTLRSGIGSLRSFQSTSIQTRSTKKVAMNQRL